MSSENTFINNLHEDTNNPYSIHITKNELLVIQQSIKWDNGSWTPEEKKVLHSKMSRCFILKEAHWEIARRCAKRYKLINFPKVICSTILASSLTLFTQQEQENKLFVYFNAILSVFVAILTTSSSFLDYNVQKARHRSSSLGYGKLVVYIDRVLRLRPDERQTFSDTLAKVNEEYASLRTEAPFLNTRIVRKYTKIYRIQVPDNAYHSKTNLKKPNNVKQNMDYVENEEYFNEIVDSIEAKAERLSRVLRPIIGPEVEPDLIKTGLRRPLPSPTLISPEITDSNNSVVSNLEYQSPTSSTPTPQD